MPKASPNKAQPARCARLSAAFSWEGATCRGRYDRDAEGNSLAQMAGTASGCAGQHMPAGAPPSSSPSWAWRGGLGALRRCVSSHRTHPARPQQQFAVHSRSAHQSPLWNVSVECGVGTDGLWRIASVWFIIFQNHFRLIVEWRLPGAYTPSDPRVGAVSACAGGSNVCHAEFALLMAPDEARRGAA